jgi:hypothetical protein
MPSTTGYSHLQVAPSGRMSHSGRRGPITSSSPLVYSRLSSVIGGAHNPNIILAARQPLRSAIAAGDREIAPRIGFFRALPRQLNWTNERFAAGDLPVGRLVDRRVESRFKKYFASPVGQIISTSSRHPTPQQGRIAIVTDAGCGCGGRGSVLRARRSQGGFLCSRERSPSERTRDVAAYGKIVWS